MKWHLRILPTWFVVSDSLDPPYGPNSTDAVWVAWREGCTSEVVGPVAVGRAAPVEEPSASMGSNSAAGGVTAPAEVGCPGLAVTPPPAPAPEVLSGSEPEAGPEGASTETAAFRCGCGTTN